MNNHDRRRLRAMFRKQPLGARVQSIAIAVSRHDFGPLTPHEQEISRRVVDDLGEVSWFHGGAAGRAVGDLLLPSRDTGADPRGLGDEITARRSSPGR